MKRYHPGTVYKINGVVVRAKRGFSCTGCIFDNLFGCPRVKDSRDIDVENTIKCKESSIIFIKP